MPVKSLNSSVLKWPDRQTVHQAVSAWAAELGRNNPHILRIGYIGSYARGDWGVGSDLDLVAILDQCDQTFYNRSLEWNTSALPVPVDLSLYALPEWQALAAQGGRFYKTVQREAVWIYQREPH